jgi:hypothetical protein
LQGRAARRIGKSAGIEFTSIFWYNKGSQRVCSLAFVPLWFEINLGHGNNPLQLGENPIK